MDDLRHPVPHLLVIATRNPGKMREFADLLGSLPVRLQAASAFPGAPVTEELAGTYEGNAKAKAVALARFTGLPALADDSGLEVDALGGAPGVHSARFAGTPVSDERNVRQLLERLRDVPWEKRSARFRCVLVLAQPDGSTISVEGTCEGFVTEQPRGCGGFGYDPVFYYPPAGRTFAEMNEAEKNAVSHRADACARLRKRLG